MSFGRPAGTALEFVFDIVDKPQWLLKNTLIDLFAGCGGLL